MTLLQFHFYSQFYLLHVPPHLFAEQPSCQFKPISSKCCIGELLPLVFTFVFLKSLMTEKPVTFSFVYADMICLVLAHMEIGVLVLDLGTVPPPPTLWMLHYYYCSFKKMLITQL